MGVQRIPSHAVHGTWVDLVMNHLDYDAKNGVFMPHPDFGLVDARLLGPIAIFVLDATKAYLEMLAYASGTVNHEALLLRNENRAEDFGVIKLSLNV